MPVLRIDLAYDGSDFHGFASQPTQRTVQGVIDGALERILGHSVDTTCAGRTDAGVHARHQVMSLSVEALPDTVRLRRSLDRMVGSEVSIGEVSVVDDGFNARFSPTWRRYRYFVDGGEAADPLRRRWAWHVGRPLDRGAMNEAAASMVGSHDFASFCRRREGATTERTVFDAVWSDDESLVVFEVRARAFCHQMVRSMTGHCVDVGLGRVDAAVTGEVLARRDRGAVGTVAPPHGLVLWEVGFD